MTDDIFGLTGAAVGIAATNYAELGASDIVSFRSVEIPDCGD